MPTICEPVLAGIVVALFNKYILGRIDSFFATCGGASFKKDDDDECTSSSSTSVAADLGHVHVHF